MSAAVTASLIVGAGLAVGTAGAATAATILDVCPAGCTYSTIQAAVSAASAGDVIQVAPGTYTGTINMKKAVTLEGAGSGTDPAENTIIEGSGSGNGIALQGSSDSAMAVVSGVRITGFASGISAGSFSVVDDVVSTGNANYGINLVNGMTELLIKNSTFSENKAGLKLGSSASASKIQVENSHFDDNSGQGWYSDKNASSGSILDQVTIVDSTFNNNPDKGFYTEKLSNAYFSNVQFNNSGNGRSSQGSGLDINLKYGDYENITLSNLAVIDSGTPATPNGTGISISARNDGSYSSNPATLENLTIDGGSVKGAVTGIYFGFDITTDPVVSNMSLAGNDLAVRNESSSTAVAVKNWWGSERPVLDDHVSGDVVATPWWADAAMTVAGYSVDPLSDVFEIPEGEPVHIVIPAESKDPRLDVSEFSGQDGEFQFTEAVTVSTDSGVTVDFPAGVLVTPADPTWGTELLAPRVVDMPSVSTPDGPGETVVAIKIGSGDTTFTLSSAVRILLPGAADSRAGFIAPGGAFTPITTECTADSQSAGDAVVADCYIAVGDDLVIWTKHFTTFAAYSLGLAATGVAVDGAIAVGAALVLFGLGLTWLRARRRMAA